VLDVTKASTTAGAHVIIYTKHGKDNQIWYDDKETGTIRSKQTGFCLDIDSNSLSICVTPYLSCIVELNIFKFLKIQTDNDYFAAILLANK